MATLNDHKNKEIIILAENQEESDDVADGYDDVIKIKPIKVKKPNKYEQLY